MSDFSNSNMPQYVLSFFLITLHALKTTEIPSKNLSGGGEFQCQVYVFIWRFTFFFYLPVISRFIIILMSDFSNSNMPKYVLSFFLITLQELLTLTLSLLLDMMRES
jgi:hypothetical protein